MSEHDDRLVRRVVAAASGRGAAEGCPDAEVLGLYAERQLDGAERIGVETHVAGCARCQGTIAMLVRSAPAGVGAAGVSVPEGAAVAGPAWWSGWKWLVPVAATAAVVTLAVWVRPPKVPGDTVVPEQAAPEATATREAPAETPSPERAMGAPAVSAPVAPVPTASARSEARRAEAPAGAETKAAGARPTDALADARERSASAAPVPPAAPEAVQPAAPGVAEAEVFARRQADSREASRADAAAPAQVTAAAGQEAAAGAARGLGAVAAAGAGAERPAQLTGRVTYRTPAALPAGAVIDVRLLDVSRVDAPATVLGRVEIVTRGEQVPVPFTIGYDAAGVDARFRYTVQATITVAGRVAYRTTTAHPVLTHGAPSSGVEVVVQEMR